MSNLSQNSRMQWWKECIQSPCSCEVYRPPGWGHRHQDNNYTDTFLIFYFETISDLQKSCKYDLEFSCAFRPASPESNIFHNYVTILKTQKSTSVQDCPVQTLFFYLYIYFSVPSFSPVSHITFSCHAFSVSSNMWQFFSLLPPWDVLRMLVSYFVERPLIWVCLMFPHD